MTALWAFTATLEPWLRLHFDFITVLYSSLLLGVLSVFYFTFMHYEHAIKLLLVI